MILVSITILSPNLHRDRAGFGARDVTARPKSPKSRSRCVTAMVTRPLFAIETVICSHDRDGLDRVTVSIGASRHGLDRKKGRVTRA